jgi:lincosamide nucleotidyltransferase A/C/D/E
MTAEPEMSSSDLVALLDLFEQASVEVWLDGGWGVDALLRRQTRRHKDVDVVVAVSDVPRLQEILAGRGFAVKEGSPPHSFVLSNGLGLEVDVHAVSFDADGSGVYRMENGQDWTYPAEGFGGSGLVEDKDVRCLSAATQVLCHAHGYQPVEKDLQDMELLAESFGIDLPPQLRRAA